MHEMQSYNNIEIHDDLFTVSSFGAESTYQPTQNPTQMSPPLPPSSLLTDLSPYEIFTITSILRTDPSNFTTPCPYDLTKLLATLPKSLLHPPTGLISQILQRFSRNNPPANHPSLCRIHKPLHPSLIHHLFLQVWHECTTRIERFDQPLSLPLPVEQFRGRMEDITALWMEPSEFRKAFPHRRFDLEIPAREKQTACEACILSLIGEDKHILLDLRASMLSRKTKSKRVPVLLPFVEGWIHWLGISKEVQVLHASEVLGKQVRIVRKRMQKERRGQISKSLDEEVYEFKTEVEKPDNLQKSKWRGEQKKEKEVDDEDTDHDFENSIIDDYIDRFSSYEVGPQEVDIHPTFRSLVAFDTQSRSFLRSRKENIEVKSGSVLDEQLTQQSQLSESAYLTSAYSDDRVSMSIGAWMDENPDDRELDEEDEESLPEYAA